ERTTIARSQCGAIIQFDFFAHPSIFRGRWLRLNAGFGCRPLYARARAHSSGRSEPWSYGSLRRHEFVAGGVDDVDGRLEERVVSVRADRSEEPVVAPRI